MGGSGGGGSSTSSTKSGPPKYVQPYARQQTDVASRLFGGGNFPQQQTANFTPDQLAAQQAVEGLSGGQQGIANYLQQLNAGLAGGQQNQYMQQAGQANQGLLNNPYVQQAQAANAAIASGANLDPSKNTALQAYINAGLAPMISNYQQAVAPNILSNAVTSGGLGSSGTEQAFQNAQSALANQMGNYTAQVIEPAYEQGLQQQMQAIGETTNLLQPQEQGIQNLAGLGSQLTGQEQAALGQSGALQQGAYTPSGQLGQVGQQQQQQAQNVLNTLFGNQMTPYQMSQMGAGLISALGGGGSQSFQIGSTPGGGK